MFNWKNSKEPQPRSAVKSGFFSLSGHEGNTEGRVNDRILNLSDALEKRLPERGYIRQ